MKTHKEQIYLDYSATTPIDQEVFSVIHSHLDSTFGNASSVHAFGRKAKIILEESREIIAHSIGAETAEIFFTSGGTESDNQALLGTAFVKNKAGKNHIIVSSIEHHAVLDCAEYAKELGFDVTYLPVDENGVVSIFSVENAITDKTCIVSIMHANNETGILQPIQQVSEITKKLNITFHSDTVQSFGKIPVDVNELGIDILALSAHKIYGPKGIGATYIRRGTELDALLHGGSQERKVRAGTENIPLIAGFAKAVELAQKNRESLYKHVQQLHSTLIEIIRTNVSGIILNSNMTVGLPHILNVSLDSSVYSIESDSLLLNMDLRGVAVSSGSACTSGSVQPSHVLLAMGRDTKTTQATIRFSFGKFTTIEEVEEAGKIFCSIVQDLSKN